MENVQNSEKANFSDTDKGPTLTDTKTKDMVDSSVSFIQSLRETLKPVETDLSAPFLLKCIEPLKIEIPSDDEESFFTKFPLERDLNELTVVSPIRKDSRPDIRGVFDLKPYDELEDSTNSINKENQKFEDSDFLRFDFKSLSHHYETSEPVKWDFNADHTDSHKFNNVASSRASEEYFAQKETPNSPGQCRFENPDEVKLLKLEKKLKSMKKKQARAEKDFIVSHGYGPSEIDRLQNTELRIMTAELNRLKREIKAVKSLETDQQKIRQKLTGGNSPSFSHFKQNRANFTLEQMCQLAWKVIEEQREIANRPSQLEEMDLAQLRQEKLSVQRVLLHLEFAHGRPVEPDDRELVRPLYDWYRKVKRFLKLSGSPRGSLGELQTIPEELHLDEFQAKSHPQSIKGLKSSQSALLFETGKDNFDTELPNLTVNDEFGEFYSSLHKLEPEQLYKIHRLLADRKSSLRKLLGSDETLKLSNEAKYGRKFFQTESNPPQQLYLDYKKLKAKLKLVDALLSKQRASC